jgi:ribosomal protein L7Ae-like RNA K-turn-binding protein
MSTYSFKNYIFYCVVISVDVEEFEYKKRLALLWEHTNSKTKYAVVSTDRALNIAI